MYKRSVIVSTAQNFIGLNEAGPEYETKILEVYNQKPLPRGYVLKPTDAWCAAFVSIVGILCGYDEIILKECSCQKMLEKYKKINRFIENDSYKPLPGDIIFYDWNDNGIGDCTGAPDHVGIVEKIEGKYITIIEGNYKNSVKRRTISQNARYIRGYAVPDYDEQEMFKRVTAYTLNVREKPGLDSKIVGYIRKNDVVLCSKAKLLNFTEWFYIPEKKGWSSGNYLKDV